MPSPISCRRLRFRLELDAPEDGDLGSDHKVDVFRGIIPQGELTHLTLPFTWLGSCFMSWSCFLLCGKTKKVSLE